MIVEKFKSTYQNMNKSNIASIEQLYSQDIEFNDPFHQILGLDALKEYFEELYLNVDSVDFEFGETLNQNDSYFIEWQMTVKHPRLKKGQPILVPGATLFRVDQSTKIIFHRDYFDAGIMLYEHIPLLGRLIKWIKGRL